MLIHDVSKVLWIWFATVNGSSGDSLMFKRLYWNRKRLVVSLGLTVLFVISLGLD